MLDEHIQDTPAPSRSRVAPPIAKTVRYPVLAGYLAVSVGLALALGRPERPYVLVWLLGLTLLATWRNPYPLARVVLDWLPLLIILAVYEVIRIQADSLIPRAHIEPQLGFDRWIGFGTPYTVRLQDSLFDPHHLKWYDYGAFVVYLTHFVAAITAGIAVYFLSRERFKLFAFSFLGFSLAGFSTYVIYPAVPPWMASQRGALAPTTRAVTAIWDHLGIEFFEKVFSGDPKYSNPVGALPSEHGAYPVLFLLFFWVVATPKWRAALIAFPLAMLFSLVYLAEHYVFDILMGWVYAVVAFVIVRQVLAWRGMLAPIDMPRRLWFTPRPVEPAESG